MAKFLSLLGEFVALNRNPDFRLSPQSNQFIDEAVRNEYEQCRTAHIHNLQINLLSAADINDSPTSNRRRRSFFKRFRSKKSESNSPATISRTSSTDSSAIFEI